MEDRLDVLEALLQWRHLVPTAPDTLTAYPFQNIDPFVLEATPHVMFAGNQPRFATRMVTGDAARHQGSMIRLCIPHRPLVTLLFVPSIGAP